MILIATQSMAQNSPIRLNKTSSAAFSEIEYTAGASGTIDLGTDNSIIYGAGYNGSGIGSAGGFIMRGSTGSSVTISCSATATLSNGVGGTITISQIDVANTTEGVGPFGAGSTCLGLSNTARIFILKKKAADNTFAYGARIDGSSGIPSGGLQFSTSNIGGSNIIFDVAYL